MNVGVSFTDVTVTVTVAVDCVVPSVIVYVNESVPLKFAFGVYVQVPVGAHEAVPNPGVVLLTIVSVGPSMSVSLPSTLSDTGLSSSVDIASLTAVGGSLTAEMLTLTVPMVACAPSETVYVKVSVPLKFGFGVYVQLVAVHATLPFVPFVLPTTVSVSHSGSVSFATGLTAPGVSSLVLIVSLNALGAPSVAVGRALNSEVSKSVARVAVAVTLDVR